MGSEVSNLSVTEEMLIRYGMSSYVTLGNIGNVLSICVFSQSDQRRNPCSLYLLSMTICNLICLDVGTIPHIFSLDHTDISSESLFVCRIQFYVRHAFFQMMRTYKIVACIDHYALCSVDVRIRSFNNCKIARRLIVIVALFWLIVCILFTVVRTIQNGSCNIFHWVYSTIYTIYYLIVAGIVPPLLILIFTILAMKNLKELRNRVQPTTGEIGRRNQPRRSIILHKRDQQLLKMVLIEVLFYVISTLPFSIDLISKMVKNHLEKDRERQEIESFFNYIAQSFLMYLNTASPFYIYVATSSSFRKQLKELLIRINALITGKAVRKERNDSIRAAVV